MSLVLTGYGQPYPRRQAQRLVELLIRQDSALRSILVGRRREGKSDLLRQVQAALFEKADGPMPFRYAFEPRRDASSTARHFAASFCQQMRAFVMRQEEMLGEPLALLERELERPGLPLALTELGREFLSLAAADQLEFAAALPAQFACREGRPLCLLLDDAEYLSTAPAFVSYLSDPRLSWLITGRRPQLQGIAASHGWQVVELQPFTLAEALSLAEDRCRQFELPFSQQTWEDWFELVGTSPCWVHRLIEGAVTSGKAVDSAEALGRIYVNELASGSIARWMESGWRNLFLSRSVTEALSTEGKERVRVAEQLLQSPVAGGSPSALLPGLWDGLVAEEWAEYTPLGPVVRLEMIQRDWLELALNAASAGMDRARAGFLQAFLLRVERVRQWRQVDGLLKDVRENLLRLPQSGSPAASPRGNKELRLPNICSIAFERTATAELFWCYGFRPGWPEERRDRPEAACLYLIALCRQEPTAAETKQWSRRLQDEARALPALAGSEKASTGGLGPRYELWLALPRGASLASAAGERRMRWEGLAQLLQQKSERVSGTLPPMLQLERAESQSRLSELEARAQWLEEELATAHEQFRKESGQFPPELDSLQAGSSEKAPGGGSEELTSRWALSASLLLAAADLLALQSQGDPAVLDSVREIQRRTKKLTDALRAQEQAPSTEANPLRSEHPPPTTES
ncbi:MAG: hypothetical protein HY316_09885 [Acidobacteria bacterium]|nr:hypothetical protein [Acidobacteriota bacterium]